MTRLALALGWILLLVSFSRGPLVAQVGPDQLQASPTSLDVPWLVTGYGLTEDSARQDAYRQAGAILARELETRSFRHWKPDLEYIRGHLQDGPGAPGTDLPLPHLGAAHTWILRLRPLDLENAQVFEDQAARRAREVHRRDWTIRIVVVGVVCLAVVGGGGWYRQRNRRVVAPPNRLARNP